MPLDAPPTTRPVDQVPEYACVRTAEPPTIDGEIDEAWGAAAWTEAFVDIESDANPEPRFRTRVKMLWDEGCLYVLAELEEPHVRGSLTERNSRIYRDNAFELFIDADGDRQRYYELEVNALETTMELVLAKPYADGGTYRLVSVAGLQTAVGVRGTVNEPGDEDAGWTVELALPLAGLAKVAGDEAGTLAAGACWRMNVARVQWPYRVEDRTYAPVPEEERTAEYSVWSPMGAVDMHRPERWGVVRFVETDAGE